MKPFSAAGLSCLVEFSTKRVALIGVMHVMFSDSGLAATCYVSPTGADNNSGSSYLWNSIYPAVSYASEVCR